jgi:hypothetical protein
MKRFRVPRREIRATVLLHGGTERRGTLFASASAPGGGPGRLSDRLNDDTERFLALAEEGPGCLVSKERIVRIDIGADQVETELASQGDAHRVRVRVELAVGPALEGVIEYTMPPGEERLLDYLNAAPRFVPLLGAEGASLLNRDYVTSVTALSGEGAEQA